MTVQVLEWDTSFFGFLTVRLSPIFPSEVAKDWNFARKAGARLGYLDAAANSEIAAAAEAIRGALAVDRRRKYRSQLGDFKDDGRTLQVAESGDSDSVIALAIQSGEWSRFAQDKRLPPELAVRLFRVWGEKSLDRQIADEVIVRRSEENDGIPIAMVTVKARGETGTVGLVAVDPGWRGRGLGRAITEDSLTWFYRQGCREVQVVTQAINGAACRTYESAGFQLVNESLTFHFWSRPDDSL